MNLSLILAAAVAANQSWTASVGERKRKQEAERKAVEERELSEQVEATNRQDLEAKAKQAYDALLGNEVEDDDQEPEPEVPSEPSLKGFVAGPGTLLDVVIPTPHGPIRVFFGK